MATTHYLIGRVTVGSGGAASIDFSSIPQTYTDLVLKVSGRMSNYIQIAGVLGFAFNGGSVNASLTTREIVGTGSGVGSSTTEWPVINGGSSTSNVFNNAEIYIPNYTSSNYKSFSVGSVIENNATTSYQRMNAFLWSNTAAISRITISGSGNFDQYSTISLYGVSSSGDATKVPYATGGDVITTDGTYWIHTFYTSGTFTPIKSLSNVEYLVVAGGGGGGSTHPFSYGGGGGGGAGGLRSTTTNTGGGGSLESKLSLTAQAYTVTVGAGGAGAAVNDASYSGSNSVFGSITSTGGGKGGTGSYYTVDIALGGNGGSGGGASGQVPRSGGNGTANQGYKGGDSVLYKSGGAGGGGASAAAADITSSDSGTAGGNGVAVSISGSSVTYAGGGGGGIYSTGTRGLGGSGGGGNGGASGGSGGGAGTANTGGGGGGGSSNSSYSGVGGNGGSGIVIVRYPV